MKIYRVVNDTPYGKRTLKLWDNYRSAVTSSAQISKKGSTVEVAWVPDSAWQPADRTVELRQQRMENLFYELVHSDTEATQELLEFLTQRAEQIAAVKKPPAPTDKLPTMKLSDEVRREAELRLGQLMASQ